MGLSGLDDYLLPLWARRVQDARDAVVQAPTPARALRALDDRCAGAVPLVRDVPVAVGLLAGAVLLAGAATGVALSPSAGSAAAGGSRVVLGPPLGADAEAWLAQAHAAAVERARTAPGARAAALVSLREQLRVARTAGLLAGSTLEVRRALVRAPVAGAPELLTVEVAGDAQRTLQAHRAATALRKAEEQRELGRQARTVPPAERASYEAAAATAGREAAAYAGDCACVLALVVEGTTAELAGLPALPVVRGIDLAPRGTPADDVEVRPLAPGVTGVVR